MSRPPDWVIESGTYIELAEFSTQFVRCVGEVRSSFRKVEAWQTYQEPETRSLDAFYRGDKSHAEELVRHEADQEIDAYRELQSKNVTLTRLRLLRHPLTPYLQWEMLNYRVRLEPRYGEHIRVVECTADEPLPGPTAFDFLLFDEAFALVHDYGTDGLQVGAWKISEPSATKGLRVLTDRLYSRSSDLRETQYMTHQTDMHSRMHAG